MGRQPNFQYTGKIFLVGGALVANFKQYVSQFSNSDTDTKYRDKVLENKFYLGGTKEKKRKDRKDKVLQICCDLRELIWERVWLVNKILWFLVVFYRFVEFLVAFSAFV